MLISYLGHACFRLIGKGAEVVTDPFTEIGLPDPEAKADLVLCSHAHRDHSHVGRTAKPGAKVLVGFTGKTGHAGVDVTGIPTFHDEDRGGKRGNNSLYVIGMDGLSLCHLGDLGHELGSEALAELDGLDVLFIPVGGFYTIGPEAANRVCDSLAPRIVIPMHFRTASHSRTFEALSTVEEFAALRGEVTRQGGPDLSVEGERLPDETKTIILEA